MSALVKDFYRSHALPSLTRQDEYDLAMRVKSGDSHAKDLLIKHYINFARLMVSKNRARGSIPLEDLMQEAMMGLSHAIDLFEPERGHRLMTYANWWIQAYLKRYIATNRSMVKQITQDGRPVMIPDDCSLDVAVGGEAGGATFLDQLEYDGPNAEELRRGVEVSRAFRAKVEKIRKNKTPLELDIIDSRFLKEDADTLQEVGKRHGLCRERVRQIEKEVEMYVQANLRDLYSEVAA